MSIIKYNTTRTKITAEYLGFVFAEYPLFPQRAGEKEIPLEEHLSFFKDRIKEKIAENKITYNLWTNKLLKTKATELKIPIEKGYVFGWDNIKNLLDNVLKIKLPKKRFKSLPDYLELKAFIEANKREGFLVLEGKIQEKFNFNLDSLLQEYREKIDYEIFKKFKHYLKNLEHLMRLIRWYEGKVRLEPWPGGWCKAESIVIEDLNFKDNRETTPIFNIYGDVIAQGVNCAHPGEIYRINKEDVKGLSTEEISKKYPKLGRKAEEVKSLLQW